MEQGRTKDVVKMFSRCTAAVLFGLFLFSGTAIAANVPLALEQITADDGSIWERVNVPGFGSNDNKCVVALSGYNGRLYAATRNDVSGFELWRTNGSGWEKLNVPGLTDQNNFYGYILPFGYVDPNTDRKKFNLMQNIWGDMIVYNGYLYLAIETGYQGNILYGSVGCQIWRFSEAGGWEPVVADANASIISGAIDAIAGCADIDGNTTAQITISEAAGYAANHFAGDILKVEALFTDNTPGLRVFTIISSDTSGMLTIQEQDFAGNGGYTGYTICAEHIIEGDPGRPSSVIPAITTGSIAHIIMASPDVSGFGEIWNKSIVDFEIFNGELYATIGLNYLYGARVWKTSDGTTWVPNSSYSFGLFHGYYPDGYPSNPTGFCWHNTVTARNGNPVCSSFTKFGKSSVTGTETLFTGGTGTGGCNGPGARVARLDTNQWNLIVDYFVDTNNTTGTNENGLGDDGYPKAFQFSNFQAWSFAEYDNKLFTGIARFKGGRMMYTATGSDVDGAWSYAVGGDNLTYTEGIGDVTNVGFNLYNYSSSLFAGSFSTVAFLPGIAINGADIWKGTGPGNNLTWTRITGNAFGDTNAVEAGAFTEFYGTLYVAISTTLPANFPGEELPGAGGAKIYRLQPQPGCGNGIRDPGEQCEENADCASYGSGWTCNNCQCEEPTLIDLVRFQAKGKLARIFLKWETASEIDTAGFNIYRADTEDGAYNKINMALIPAKGSATEGAAYKFVDWNVEKGKTYFYKLEDVEIDANETSGTTLHEPPVSAKAWFLLKGKGPKPPFAR